MFLLMASVIVLDTLLESLLDASVRTPVLAFLLIMGVLSIMEHSPNERWARTSLSRKVLMASAPMMLSLLLQVVR
jgi:hypothetical protein